MSEETPDLIVYLDEDNVAKNSYVKIIDFTNPSGIITFQLKSGNVISIPVHRLIKIKQNSNAGEND